MDPMGYENGHWLREFSHQTHQTERFSASQTVNVYQRSEASFLNIASGKLTVSELENHHL